MRIPRGLAWLLLLSAFFTAGLLRQFHDHTPRSPYVSPYFGSLLFAIVLLLALVFLRESRVERLGPGVRLGSILPLMLMLFVEKWVSLSWYNPVFFWISPKDADDRYLDAYFALFAGGCLLLLSLGLGLLSLPARRWTRRMAGFDTVPAALLGAAIVVGGSYAVLSLLGLALGVSSTVRFPPLTGLLVWILAGQLVIAFAEELYYRGLLLTEVHRLVPRLGVGSLAGRRWIALVTTALLFGFEHIRLAPPWPAMWRQVVFSISLGLLFGMLVLITRNLLFVALVHAWINWLLLGATPRLVAEDGRALLPPGTYIGLALLLAFAYGYLRYRGPVNAPARTPPGRT